MVLNLKERLQLNRIEAVVLVALFAAVLLFATVNIVWLANKFGVHLTNHLTNSILNAVSNGSSLGSAFAVIAGVTLPGWAVAAVGALGATAA
ncbi:cyclic bacteriocin, class V [Lactiplantibacillus pentosus KCA1]|nr:class IIc cyclic bacteriocin [Lactiplantibacillus pentosus]EIW14922.1 cyclic bacteriocin, class V [Lactiplantibacillus pentosus KCA1]